MRVLGDSCEDTVNALLGAMVAAAQQLSLKRGSLGSVEEAVVEVGTFTQGGTPFFGIDGHLDAPLAGGGSVVWAFACWRSGSGWRVTRDVTLYPTQGEDVVDHLQECEYADSGELAAALPGLVTELLAVSTPTPSP